MLAGVIQAVGSDSKRIEVELRINHTTSSSSSAYQVKVTDDFYGFEIDQMSIETTPDGLLYMSFLSSSAVRAVVNEYQPSDGPVLIRYQADALGDSQFPQGKTNHSVTVEYRSAPAVSLP